ncbi:hypothetical protein [Shewanella sp. CG12_big_fil_rev_8_21_14_0_65_47_15]|uniref:hypothetical protein n=1 Tax=Shewanella sp. CG12_big_fil_rev_8_21_14_0_65_47_15 TaxID=1975537 RepID=UPI000CB4CEC8|nr:hypothetical protein [Shewanella sp. CG12_big_fil_rev_8_21_14_0_65_47_15]PIW60070.1 MAG: hypothetical protein COW15_14370 [Shewanella sp. CG12_big_fil_rev_8_21_14_0_65_47_15]
MSYLKLFRKEALKHQYQSQEFGDSVIEQPLALNRSLVILVAALGLFFALVISYPLVSTQKYELTVHDSNYLPLVSPIPLTLDRHLLLDGSAVNAKQAVSQVRIFKADSRVEEIDVLLSPEAGYYFANITAGTAVPAFQPLAKILRHNPENIYFFWLIEADPQRFKPGQTVVLQAGTKRASGMIHSIIGPYQNNRLNIGIRLAPPYDLAILTPNVTAELELSVRRDNFFKLLSQS